MGVIFQLFFNLLGLYVHAVLSFPPNYSLLITNSKNDYFIRE